MKVRRVMDVMARLQNSAVLEGLRPPNLVSGSQVEVCYQGIDVRLATGDRAGRNQVDSVRPSRSVCHLGRVLAMLTPPGNTAFSNTVTLPV
jgi:hypothetical protein